MNALDEMRSCLSDCSWADEVDVDDLSPAEVVKGIARHYIGGVNQFMLDMVGSVTA
jgi:hypothetical protein